MYYSSSNKNLYLNNELATSITIPDSVTSIGRGAFYGCTSLTSVTIGNSVTSIGDYAFYNCTSLTSITIPDSVTSIGELAFSGCTGLTSIVIPDSVTSVGYAAFSGCTGLIKIIGPSDAVSAVAKQCDSKAIAEIVITSGTSISDSAFRDCTSLTTVTIPDSVTSIGGGAFSGCYRLIEVYNKSALSITAGSYDNGGVAYYAKNVYTNEGGSKLTTDENGYVIYTDGDEKILVAYYGTNTELVLPSDITKINQYAFQGCTGLTSVTIGNGVTSIDWYAFSGCTGLTSVTIGSGVTSIGLYAFSGCTGLTSITFNGTKAQWNAISKGYDWKKGVPSTCKVVCTDEEIPISEA